jgi:protein required for attachment to host cells
MSEYCVVVAGSTETRIFTLEPAEIPEIQSGPNLVERTALIGPQQQNHEARPGIERRRSRVANGQVHSYDDGGENHDREATRKFARDIVSAVERTVNRNGLQHVVLCADRRMLGVLRPTLNGNLANQVAVHEVPKDLGKLSCHELHDKLSRTGYLPHRRRGATA